MSTSTQSKPSADFLVVGIGASAGGLEALERLFSRMAPDAGMAFVVVQHLSPDFESQMDELLGRQTRLPIHRVTDGMQVEPNAIYLIPPRKEMIISGGRLLLTDKDDVRGFSLPIDHFFRSLAHDMGRRGIAIVLSGAGSDGSRGIRDVHEAGGLVLCQLPETARFQGMPLSAKQTGVVDLFLKPEEMPQALTRYAQDPARLEPTDEERLPPGSPIEDILRLLRAEYGIDFAHYKPSTVGRRIERRLALSNHVDIANYARHLATNPEELNALYRDLLVGVTRFFRDVEAFQVIEREVLPAILARVPADEEIRIWCAGCATGEEPYSLAILLHEQLEAAHRPLNLRIFATDVHRASLDVASAGIYEEEALTDVTPTRRQRYFNRDGHRYRVGKELRQCIVFARHNVITDAPFTRLDLVSCRNLLIYFQPLIQKKVLSLFHFGLKTGGVMLLGPSETPGEIADEFDGIDAHWRIYRKRRDARLPELRLPISISSAEPATRPFLPGGRSWPGPHLLSIYDQLLNKVMPPSLLVDEHHQLVHTFGGAEKLLRVKPGRTSSSVLDMVTDNLKTALLGALQHAHKEQKSVRFVGVPVHRSDQAAEEYHITVEPIGERHSPHPHYLITLESAGPAAMAMGAAAVDVSEEARDYTTALESELRFTKESLQATIEELETANEELQATNEELVASNEELQSTNEELHSVNEELYTVNVEHQRKISQLAELTDDLDNLLHSIDVGVLFLDDNLCIRKYTAQMARVFRLLPQDVGRRFDSFAHTIMHADLEGDVQKVLETREPLNREVTSRDGVIYLLRVLPYRAASGKGGVVITLIDVTPLKQSEAHVRRLSAIVESSNDAILAKDLQGRIFSWNRGAQLLYGWPPEEAIGRHASFLAPDERRSEVEEIMARVRRGESVGPYETVRVRRDGTSIDVQISVSPVYDEHNQVIGASTIARDVTQRKRDEAEVRRALRMRDQFMAMLSHELRNPLAALMHACALLEKAEHDSERGRKARGAVERQCKHMARLLDDLLDVSRMRQEGVELRKQHIDLRTTIEAALERARPLAEQAGVKLEVSLPATEVPVFGDPDRLQQVEINLLGNAIKYSPSGSTVHLSLASENGEAVLRVRDQGIGIPADMLERVFEPFVRAVDDDKPVHGPASGGMGLGLALVRSFVRAHGGEVRAYSKGSGQGSEFVVTIPVSHAVMRATSHEIRFEGGAEALVIVEDQDDSRELLKDVLESAGYTVLTASDGKSAVELIQQHRPAIALVDIGLPVLSGYDVAREVRQAFGPADIFLVALTGYGQQQDREAVLQAGFDQHLVKPVEVETLLDVLRSRRRLRSGNGAAAH